MDERHAALRNAIMRADSKEEWRDALAWPYAAVSPDEDRAAPRYRPARRGGTRSPPAAAMSGPLSRPVGGRGRERLGEGATAGASPMPRP